jgi:replicative DNA helicase
MTIPEIFPPKSRHRGPQRKQSSTIFRSMGISQQTRETIDDCRLSYGNHSGFLPYMAEPQRSFDTGPADLDIGPGRITLVGGMPKLGKTDYVTQAVVDMARQTPGVMVFIANAEMSRSALMARQIARLSGYPGPLPEGDTRESDLPKEIQDRIIAAREELRAIGTGEDRRDCGDDDIEHITEGMYETAIQFVEPPFDTLNLTILVAEAEQYARRRPDQIILVVDYIQRFAALDRTKFQKWKRYCERTKKAVPPPLVRTVDEVMSELRLIAQTGVCVVAVSSLSRDAYDGATLGGFRGSAELEYGCDDAFVLARDESDQSIVHVRHLASRNSAPRDRVLRFNGALHRFTALEGGV